MQTYKRKWVYVFHAIHSVTGKEYFWSSTPVFENDDEVEQLIQHPNYLRRYQFENGRFKEVEE